MSRAEWLYAALPVGLQHAAVSSFGALWYWNRFGPGYSRSAEAYQHAERLTKRDLGLYVHERLRRFLTDCSERVPYYADVWSSTQKRAARAGRLEELPLLEKSVPRSKPTSLIRSDILVRRPFVFHTSGSTGTPIATYWSHRDLRDSLALREVRSANWAGVSFRMPRATFSGRVVEPDPHSSGPYYRFNAVERQVYFSAFHLSPETAETYVRALRRHRIQWGTGYAVSWATLGKFMLERGLPPPGLKAIITTSEKVTREMRSVMETAFDCPVFEEYSSVENAVFASECSARRLHVSTDAGIVEILDPSGKACPPGQPGEVVATCLSRLYQPFVRFRLGDMATWSPEPCECGLPFPVLEEVVGRLEDVVVGPDGREMVRFHGIFVDLPHVREGQVVQHQVDHIELKVVVAPEFGEEDARTMRDRIHQRLGPVRVDVACVPEIQREKSGKFRAVISHVKRPRSPAA